MSNKKLTSADIDRFIDMIGDTEPDEFIVDHLNNIQDKIIMEQKIKQLEQHNQQLLHNQQLKQNNITINVQHSNPVVVKETFIPYERLPLWNKVLFNCGYYG